MLAKMGLLIRGTLRLPLCAEIVKTRWLVTQTKATSNRGSNDPNLSKLVSFANTLSQDIPGEEKSNMEDMTEPSLTHLYNLPEFRSAELQSKSADLGYINVTDSSALSQSETKTYTRWTLKETERLIEVVESNRFTRLGRVSWREVIKHFKGRTVDACRERYYRFRIQNDGEAKTAADNYRDKQRASPKEINAIEEAVSIHGEHSWVKVAEHIKQVSGVSRRPSVLYSLWHLGICPKIKAAPPWDEEKTERLRSLMHMHGKDELFLTHKFFPEYTPLYIKCILNTLEKKQKARDPRIRYLFSKEYQISTPTKDNAAIQQTRKPKNP
ncbi:hypothetical protein BX070DRAFT_72057 [Coemansia spiralis]|nr:hypothetical protein BX070DRAFT_72057 [Coemansia spiralis]